MAPLYQRMKKNYRLEGGVDDAMSNGLKGNYRADPSARPGEKHNE
jgi:hypothetical protein